MNDPCIIIFYRVYWGNGDMAWKVLGGEEMISLLGVIKPSVSSFLVRKASLRHSSQSPKLSNIASRVCDNSRSRNVTGLT